MPKINPHYQDPHIKRASYALMQAHNSRVTQYRKRYPNCARLKLPSLELIGATAGETYSDIVLAMVRRSRVRLSDYGSHWQFRLLTLPASNLRPDMALHKSNIKIHLRSSGRSRWRNEVIQTKVLRWLLMLRDESILRIPCAEGQIALADLDKLARHALRLPSQAHISTSLVLGLRLLGLSSANGLLWTGGRLALGP